jgi:hypothetical protein
VPAGEPMTFEHPLGEGDVAAQLGDQLDRPTGSDRPVLTLSKNRRN